MHPLRSFFHSFRRPANCRQETIRSYRPAFDALEARWLPSAVTLGAAANYGVLALQNTQIQNSNAFINGDEGVSQGGRLTNSAASTITGNVYEYGSGQYSGSGTLGGAVISDAARLSQGDTDALTAANQAAALTPTQTLGSVRTPTTLAGNGGLNVIAVNGNITSSLILTGSTSDVFIVNVTGAATLGGSATLGVGGGVTADHVLYNFTGNNSTISTSGGNVLNGTLLAPTYSFSLDGTVNGEIVGGNARVGLLGDLLGLGSKITLFTGAHVNQVSFAFPVATASLSGHVFKDANSNGVRDAGENGLGGVLITLKGTDVNGNSVNVSTYTDDTGAYSFTGLAAGNYTLVEGMVDGFTHGQASPGTVNGAQDGNSDSAVISSITLHAGDNGVNYDFAELAGGGGPNS
jgi:hypothetical protein